MQVYIICTYLYLKNITFYLFIFVKTILNLKTYIFKKNLPIGICLASHTVTELRLLRPVDTIFLVALLYLYSNLLNIGL